LSQNSREGASYSLAELKNEVEYLGKGAATADTSVKEDVH